MIGVTYDMAVKPVHIDNSTAWTQSGSSRSRQPATARFRGDAYGDMVVDTAKARPAPGPGGLRRLLWYGRHLKPTPAAYALQTEAELCEASGPSGP